MLELFRKGGPIMWPLLVLSIIALTVLLERLVFHRARARCNSRLASRRARAFQSPRLISKIMCSPDRCPLCGQPNECQPAAQGDCKGPCWCMDENFPPKLLARVPAEARRCACICQRCVREAQSAETK